MLKSCMLISFICKVVLYSRFANGEEDSEAEIMKKVLEDYDPSLSPALFSNSAHKLFILLRIFRITGLDEKKGEFSVEGSLMTAWVDARFSWDSNTVKGFSVEPKSIWMPSLYIYNGIELEELTSNTLPFVVQGGAYWEPRYNIKTSCNFNLKYYPFDKQVCDIIIASRIKEGDFMYSDKPPSESFINASAVTTFMIQNPHWSHDPPQVFHKNMETDSDTLRNVAIYRFSVQRSMPLIPLGILTPCMCCNILLLTTFWMQPGNILRTGLCVTSMLVSSSNLFILGKILPASGSSTPIIVEYVSITLILSALSSIQATIASAFRRCEKLPPVSYSKVISSFPNWCLFLMGISPANAFSKQLDQKFLFSEFDDIESRNAIETEEINANDENASSPVSLQHIWLKYITLFDRIMFYFLGSIMLLFAISVMITE